MLTSCDSSSDTANPDSESVSAASKEVTVPISAVTTAVLDPGSEPRQLLVPHPAPGSTQQVTLRTEYRIQQKINDQENQDFSAPGLSIALTAAAAKDGVDLTLGKITTTDSKLAQELGPAEGSHAGLTTTAAGAVSALRISPAPGAADAARSAVEQAFYQAVYRAVTLPDSAIGVGAVWTMRQQVSGSITLDQLTTATLTALEGDRLEIALDVTQTPKSPEWNLPNGAGMLNIDQYVMHGTGTVTLDLALPLPVDGIVTVGGDQTYSDPQSSTKLRQSTSNLVQWSQ